MTRSALVLIAGVAIGMGGLALAKPSAHPAGSGEEVNVLNTYDLEGKIEGKDAAVTMVEVAFAPWGAGTSHRHPGPAFVYVIEGTYELGIDDQPTKTFKAGEIFHEPAGCLHRVSRNPSTSAKTRLIAYVVHPRGVKDILTPAEH